MVLKDPVGIKKKDEEWQINFTSLRDAINRNYSPWHSTTEFFMEKEMGGSKQSSLLFKML